MTKFAKLIYGLAYHTGGELYNRGVEVPVSDEVADELALETEDTVEFIGSTYVKTQHPRFLITERELTDAEKLTQILAETADSDAAKPKLGRPKTVKETVAEMSDEDLNK